jgi:hypothetical protein
MLTDGLTQAQGIVMYLQRYHDITISQSGVWRILNPGRAAVRRADHRDRADGLGPVPGQPPSAGVGRAHREGIGDAGGIALEFPVHRWQETGKRPTAALDRNLACLGLVEVPYGYPLDGWCLPPGATRGPRSAVKRFVWLRSL